MSKHRRKKDPFSFFDEIFDSSFEELFSGVPGEGASGYSITVTYDEFGKPVVRVKTYGGVDEAELRRSIKEKYPGARVEGLESKPLISFIDEKTETGKKPERAEKQRKPLIRELD